MKRYEVVCGLIIDNDKILICKRGPNRALEGFYEFPGGKIEPNESKENAIIREIKEELDINIKINKYIGFIEHIYHFDDNKNDDFYLKMHGFICQIESGNIKLNEHTDKKWVKKDELKFINFADADKKIIEIFKN